MHHRKAAYRPGAKGQQRKACNQRGDVGVQNRCPGSLVANVDGRLRRCAVAQLFPYPLVNQHVRINGHTESQRHGGHAGQRQGSLQHRQNRDQQQQIDGQCHARNHAKQHVVNRHEHHNHGKAVRHALETLGNIFGTQRGAYGAFFDDLHRCCERTRSQQQRQVIGLRHAHRARNLKPVAQLALNHRCGQHLALAFFKQQDGHAFFQVFAAGVTHDAATFGINRQIDFGLLTL